MSFKNLISKAGQAIGEEVNKKAEEMKKATIKDLRRRTDSEIRKLYETRNSNPNLKSWQKKLVVEEAERRNIK